MKDFFKFREQLNEFNLRKAFATAGKKISNLVKRGMKKLGWGKKVTLKIDIGSYLQESMEEEGLLLQEAKGSTEYNSVVATLRRLNGIYAEALTAAAIGDKLGKNFADHKSYAEDVRKKMEDAAKKGILKKYPTGLKLSASDKKKTVDAYNKSVAISVKNSSILADLILKDVRDYDPELYDAGLVDVVPRHTGGDTKFHETKADLQIDVSIPSKVAVKKTILASLKSYAKAGTIKGDGSGSSFKRMLDELFLEGNGPSNEEEFYKAFSKKYRYSGIKQDFANLYMAQEPFKKSKDEIWYWPDTGEELTADEINAESKKYNQQGKDSFLRIFNNAYKKNKTETDQAMLRLLNFNTDDVLYGVYGDAKISTRSSPKIQELIAELEKGFDIEIQMNTAESFGGKVYFKNGDTVIYTGSISGSRSSGKATFAFSSILTSFADRPQKMKKSGSTRRVSKNVPEKEKPAIETNRDELLKLRSELGIERDSPKGKEFTKDARGLTFDQLRNKYK